MATATLEREKLSRIVMGLPDNKVIKAIDLIENLSVDGDEPDTMTRRALFREHLDAMKGRGLSEMSTDKIMRLTRGEA
ncbi:hypothetical protein FACS1894204_13220 [Synergistales bacterium]|nr:hypothetical protein FACS1894204_13220 [Synergistales bacterium]